MSMYRTEIIKLPFVQHFVEICNHSRIVFNSSQYFIRQEFGKNGRFPSHKEVTTHILQGFEQAKECMGFDAAYKSIDAAINTWKSYFKALKAWKKDPSKFTAKPLQPGFSNKTFRGHRLFPVRITKKNLRLRGGIFLSHPKQTGISFSRSAVRITDIDNHAGGYLVPTVKGFEFHLLSKENVPDPIDGPHRVVAIDLGVSNIMAVVNNVGELPMLYPGGKLKSYNHYYNKEAAKLKTKYASQGITTGSKFQRLTTKRNNVVKTHLHAYSRHLVNWCIKHQIDTIVVGYNELWKQQVAIGKRNNQNFVYIAHAMLVNQIEFKTRQVGISVIKTEESYTSKCSFLDDEPLTHHSSYRGIRRPRGLFTASDGTIEDCNNIDIADNNSVSINADLNGAANIGRKVLSQHFPKGIKLSTPVVVKL